MGRRVGMVVNTSSPTKRRTVDDGYAIRRMATEFQIPVVTRMEVALTISSALKEELSTFLRVRSLDEYLFTRLARTDI
jgi:carbamoyl-phosphate synthase